MEFHELETERLKLVHISEHHIDRYYAIMSQDEVTRYYGMPSLTSRVLAENIVRSFSDGFQEKNCIRWGMIWKETDEFIGTIGLNQWSPYSRKAEVGYELDPLFWRRGITSEALSEVIQYSFKDLNLFRLGAVTFPANEPSYALLKRLGFQEEGRLRGYLFQDDRNHDALLFSLLREEWSEEEK